MILVVLLLKPIKLVLNGKEINLTADNTVIKSTNFNVDKNGNVTANNIKATNANITGNLQAGSTITSSQIKNGNVSIATNGRIDIVDNGGSNGAYLRFKSADGEFDTFIASDSIVLANKIYGESTQIDPSGIMTPVLNVDNNITAGKISLIGAGYTMNGKDTSHIYKCHWTGSQLQFWVDETNVGTLSDKRLKTEIKKIDEDFIKAIKEVEMKQFKIANRNGLISFGILAQDLIEIFKKYNKNPFDYEIVQETQYKTDDDTIYYTINYEQYLILKIKAQEIELQNQQKTINDLIKRIERLEGK